MWKKITIKRTASIILLALALAATSLGAWASPLAQAPEEAPSAIGCGDFASCAMGGPAIQVYNSGTGAAIYGQNTSGISGAGVYGRAQQGAGVRAQSNSGNGLFASSYNTAGIRGRSTWGAGIRAESVHGSAVLVPGAGDSGVDVLSAAHGGIRVRSAGWDGIEVNSAGWSGIWVQSSGYDAIRVQTAGQDGLRFFEGMGRDYIRAGSDADLDFRVLSSGEVRSDIGFNTPASDFAEMMDVEGHTASYEPGDVLVVSDAQDRAVELSSGAYSPAVIGVYSTQPGFVGGQPVSDDESASDIPVALVGIVPCKVSTENGVIHRGDLLVTSSTPGHAMRAEEPPPGTILGKALESLEEGTGVILVLVTLQ